jgi:hypothetical protein
LVAFGLDGLDGGPQALVYEFLPVQGAGGIATLFCPGGGQAEPFDSLLVGLEFTLELALELSGGCHSGVQEQGADLWVLDQLSGCCPDWHDNRRVDARQANGEEGSIGCSLDLKGGGWDLLVEDQAEACGCGQDG